MVGAAILGAANGALSLFNKGKDAQLGAQNFRYYREQNANDEQASKLNYLIGEKRNAELIGIGAGIFLIAFLVWMKFFRK